MCFVVTERTIHPTVFEAIASLRGDIANEGVQHHELANSIQKEVIEPLSRLNDRNEKVQRIVRLGASAQGRATILLAVSRAERRSQACDKRSPSRLRSMPQADRPIPLTSPASL